MVAFTFKTKASLMQPIHQEIFSNKNWTKEQAYEKLYQKYKQEINDTTVLNHRILKSTASIFMMLSWLPFLNILKKITIDEIPVEKVQPKFKQAGLSSFVVFIIGFVFSRIYDPLKDPKFLAKKAVLKATEIRTKHLGYKYLKDSSFTGLKNQDIIDIISHEIPEIKSYKEFLDRHGSELLPLLPKKLLEETLKPLFINYYTENPLQEGFLTEKACFQLDRY